MFLALLSLMSYLFFFFLRGIFTVPYFVNVGADYSDSINERRTEDHIRWLSTIVLQKR